jgi:hypothetical protein
MTDEIWKPIAGFDDYQVSSLGRVRRADNGHLLTINRSEHYSRVFMSRNKKRFTRYVHSLVAAAFHDERPPGLECRHHPHQVSANNYACNLSWCSHSQNERDKLVKSARRRPALVRKWMREIMKIEPSTSFYDDDGEINVKAEFRFADWKDSRDEVLASVDALLRPYGLEITLYETETDTYAFSSDKGHGAPVMERDK